MNSERLLPGEAVGPSGRLVLLLTGGTDRSARPASESASLKTRQLQSSLMRRLGSSDTAVRVLRYRVKGWNGAPGQVPDPVVDARNCLEFLRDRYPGLQVVLVGHSMGGRTAVAVADDPAVVGVIGIAPWLPPGEPVEPLRGKPIAAAHGSHLDWWTHYSQTEQFLHRARSVASSIELVDMGYADHWLLLKWFAWCNFIASRSIRFLTEVDTADGRS